MAWNYKSYCRRRGCGMPKSFLYKISFVSGNTSKAAATAIMFALLICGVRMAHAQASVPLKAETLAGLSQGGVDKFLGIPYAEPPVGELRWHPPHPVSFLEGIRDATQFASSCPQRLSIPGPSDRSMKEDCLYLNIYRPSVSLLHDPYPVMVWIHGGSNISGSGSDYDPEKMVRDNKIIVVTINYRLGVFGFLPIPTKEAHEGNESGNFGLMDQQAALSWVRDNIAFFGGDPSKVTVAGESAGAFDICAQLASPKAHGLFQQAIMQSFECKQHNKERAVLAASAVVHGVGCDQSTDVASCMLAQSTRSLLKAGKDVQYSAYVDGDVLPLQPEDAIASGNWNNVPILLGSNNGESGTIVFGSLKLQELKQGMNQLSEMQYWPLTQDTYISILNSVLGDNASAVEAEYTSSSYPSPFSALSGIYTDTSALGCEVSSEADVIALKTPTFRYEFSDLNTSLPPGLADAAGMSLGAYHAGELQYLFSEKGYPGPQSTSQQALSERMMRYWASFVKKGDPSDDRGIHWPRYRVEEPALVVLSPLGDSISNNFDVEHHCQFWKTTPPPTKPSGDIIIQ